MQATSADANKAASSRVGQPVGDVHDVGDPQFGDEFVGGAIGLHLGDQPQLEVPDGAQSGDRLQQGADALQRGVGAGDRDDAAGLRGGRTPV